MYNKTIALQQASKKENPIDFMVDCGGAFGLAVIFLPFVEQSTVNLFKVLSTGLNKRRHYYV